MFAETWGCCRMRGVLDYCTGGIQRDVSAGALIIREGGTSGHLYVLIEGQLEVLKGDTVVASISEPGAIVGEVSVVVGGARAATVRAAAGGTGDEVGGGGAFVRDGPA